MRRCTFILAVCLLKHGAELGARPASSEQRRRQVIAAPVRSWPSAVGRPSPAGLHACEIATTGRDDIGMSCRDKGEAIKQCPAYVSAFVLVRELRRMCQRPCCVGMTGAGRVHESAMGEIPTALIRNLFGYQQNWKLTPAVRICTLL